MIDVAAIVGPIACVSFAAIIIDPADRLEIPAPLRTKTRFDLRSAALLQPRSGLESPDAVLTCVNALWRCSAPDRRHCEQPRPLACR
jgi:hypothetical protein